MIVRPILFSGAMVRAILDGQKTQTRRTVKQQLTPIYDSSDMFCFYHKGINYRTSSRTLTVGAFEQLKQFCPYGQPGDRLWVRETFGIKIRNIGGSSGEFYTYRATDPDAGYCSISSGGEIPIKWKPSIHMPRWASRITLKIVSVHVERLRDISEEDAKAEGVTPSGVGLDLDHLKYRAGFQTLWESINGPESWDTNPWVWVIEFAVVTE